MLGHNRCNLRQIDPLEEADVLGRQSRVQVAPAAGAAIGTMLDDLVSVIAHGPAVALVTEIGPTGLGLREPLLPIRCGRLRRGA